MKEPSAAERGSGTPPLPVPELNARRREAVALRLDGRTLAEAALASRLSVPTVVSAYRAWQQGGWEAVNVRPRGRKPAGQRPLERNDEEALVARWREPATGLWSLQRAATQARAAHPTLTGLANSQLEGLVTRLWQREGLTPPNTWDAWRRVRTGSLADWLERELPALRREAAALRVQVLALSERTLPGWPTQRNCQLAAHNGRGTAWWQLTPGWPTETDWISFMSALRAQAGCPLWLLTDNRWLSQCPALSAWLREPSHGVTLLHPPEPARNGTLPRP
jgi:sulfate adenylyltransferase subunit 2